MEATMGFFLLVRNGKEAAQTGKGNKTMYFKADEDEMKIWYNQNQFEYYHEIKRWESM